MTSNKVTIAPSPMNADGRNKQLATYVERGIDQLSSYSSRGTKADRQKRVRKIAEAHRLTCSGNDYLMSCAVKSHYEFVAFCLTVDLVPGKAGGGKIWAVPFKGQVVPIIGHKGYMTLWQRGHPDDGFEVRLVYKGEDFDFDHKDGRISHPFSGWDTPTELEDIVGGYVQIRRRGEVIANSHPIRMRELLKRARSSQSYVAESEEKHPDKPWLWFKKSSAWASWYEEMLKKTLVRMFLSSGAVSLEKAGDLERVVGIEAKMADDGPETYAKVAGVEAPEGIEDDVAALPQEEQVKAPKVDSENEVEYGAEDEYALEMAREADAEKGESK